jgi:hypothetical protein
MSSRVQRYQSGAVLVAVSTLGFLGAAGVPAPRAARAASALTAAGSPALFNRTTYGFSSVLTTGQEAAQYNVMVMQSTDAPTVAQLHAANPNLKVFMYQNVLFSLGTDPTGATTCTGYQNDSASHPTWFMLDSHGNRILDHVYANEYIMDVGNAGYQQACVAHAVALAKQSGFDGVYFDGLAATLAYTLPAGVSVAEYPNDPAWQAAVYSLVSYAGPSSKAQGVPIIGNIGGSTLTPGLWQKWTAPLAGSEEESFTDGGAGLAQQIRDWPTKLANVAWSEANGKIVLLHSWNTTQTGNRYGLASMMLVANGQSSYSTSNGDYGSYETWYPEYTVARYLGAPRGVYTQFANGVYQRRFANGIVLVNPTARSIPTFSLGGGTYSGSQLSNVSSVSMGPTSGLILIGVGGTTSSATGPAARAQRPKRKPRVRCIVPKLAHLKLADAQKVISRAHCRVGRITRKRSSRRNRRRVLAQRPAAHKQLASMAKVNLAVGR